MSRHFFKLLFFMLVGATVSGCCSDSGVCRLSKLPLSSGKLLSELTLGDSVVFAAGGEEYSSASIRIKNESTIPLTAVALVVEFSMPSSAHPILTIPFRATTKNFGVAAGIFRSSQQLTEIIAPHASIELEAASEILLRNCPTTARVIYEHVWYSNGVEEKMGDLINIDPTIDVLPSYFDFRGCDLPRQADILIDLSIDGSGRPSLEYPYGSAGTPTQCLEREIGIWRFVPRVIDGVPTASRMTLLLRFHQAGVTPSQAPLVNGFKAASQITVVHFVWSKNTDSELQIFYAGGCCGNKVRSRDLY